MSRLAEAAVAMVAAWQTGCLYSVSWCAGVGCIRVPAVCRCADTFVSTTGTQVRRVYAVVWSAYTVPRDRPAEPLRN